MFSLEVPIRFGDIDRAGIVYYPNYFHYYHVAFEEFFQAAHGMCYADWISLRRIGFPTVHVVADFGAPLRYGDPLRIDVAIPRVGDSSVDFRFFARGAEDKVCARATVTKVCVHMDKLRPEPIPQDLREVFGRCQGES